MKIGIAYHAFMYDFKHFYPDLELIKEPSQVADYDLIIFSGGEDINPSIYGEPNQYSYFSSERDAAELLILRQALEYKKFILGVCRGHQLISAYLGGSLYQDLSFQAERHPSYHELEIYDKELEQFFSTGVNSLHHQGVKYSPSSLTVTSIYKGIPESLKGKGIITVQFHPEFMQADGFFKWVLEKADMFKERKGMSSVTTAYKNRVKRLNNER